MHVHRTYKDFDPAHCYETYIVYFFNLIDKDGYAVQNDCLEWYLI